MKTLVGLLLVTLAVNADVGIKEGGGGAHIESQFRIRARELVNAATALESANLLCPSAALKTALTSSIRVVKEVSDPKGRCKSTQELDACTYPGDIQLKQATWERLFSQPQTKIGSRGLDALILHEMYRAAKGCDDDNFAITDKVFPQIESTPATFAPPIYSWRSCFATIQMREKDGQEKSEEYTLEDTEISWMDGAKRYQIDFREYDDAKGRRLGIVTQAMSQRVGDDPKRYTNNDSGIYFEIAEGEVISEAFEGKFDVVREAKNRFASKEVTHADPSKNLGKVVHTITPGPEGFETRLEEQVEPDPVGSDGRQRLAHKYLCTKKTISAEEVDYSGIFKLKSQVQVFSKAHMKAMLAKNLWQSCQEGAVNADCSLQKLAFDKSDAERTSIWKKLIKESDLGKPYAEVKKASEKKKETSSNGGGDPYCAKMKSTFNSCLNLAKKYGRFCPTSDSLIAGHCVDVGYWYTYCTGKIGPWWCRPNYR